MIDLDHVAIASENIAPILNALVGELGAKTLFGGANVGFRAMQVDAGSSRIELLEPYNVDANDFLARFLAKSGEGPHHMTFKTDNIRRELQRAEEAGFVPVNVMLGNEWWQEAFLHPKQAGGTVVQLAQSAIDPTDIDPEVIQAASERGDLGPMQWWPDPPNAAEPAARLERIVVTTEDLDVGRRLYEDLLHGESEGFGDGWFDLVWPHGGRIRIEAAAGRTPGIDRLEWTHDGAYTERVIGGARFVLYPA
jgi:catechol 2,3-dioxygenase-like lactoylglutathione lyase family enzyme